jgi:hypothetical protein
MGHTAASQSAVASAIEALKLLPPVFSSPDFLLARRQMPSVTHPNLRGSVPQFVSRWANRSLSTRPALTLPDFHRRSNVQFFRSRQVPHQASLSCREVFIRWTLGSAAFHRQSDIHYPPRTDWSNSFFLFMVHASLLFRIVQQRLSLRDSNTVSLRQCLHSGRAYGSTNVAQTLGRNAAAAYSLALFVFRRAELSAGESCIPSGSLRRSRLAECRKLGQTETTGRRKPHPCTVSAGGV